MSRRLIIVIFALMLAIVPTSAFAQEAGNPEDEFLLKINGTLALEADETVGAAVIISGDAVIDGTVTEALIVIDGNAEVTGTVEGDINVISGTVTLTETAMVENVALYDSEIVRADGATVRGDVTDENFSWSGWDVVAFSAYVWLSMTLIVVVGGLLFAAIGARQLLRAGDLITERPGGTILAAVIVGIGIPVAAALIMFTLVGIPLAIGLLLFLMPALWFLGYIVAGTRLGAAIVGQFRPGAVEHPYLAAVVGLFVLQVIQLIPFLGGLITFLAGVIGTGALALLAWHAWRGDRERPVAEPGPMLEQPAPTA